MKEFVRHSAGHRKKVTELSLNIPASETLTALRDEEGGGEGVGGVGACWEEGRKWKLL